MLKQIKLPSIDNRFYDLKVRTQNKFTVSETRTFINTDKVIDDNNIRKS